MNWEVVIGLEIHAQLKTKSKIFSGASTAFGAEPNTQACALDLGLPGVLPVLNKEAVNMAIKFGIATHCDIAPKNVFARKNYFYPDLPKGYQTSQMDLPIVGVGQLEILLEDGSTKKIGITRAHLEEDAGKSLHEEFQGLTGIDLNRAGTPLLEIVSDPDLSSAKEAVAYARKIHSLVQYIDICDGNMQEGSLRCDANVSIKKKDATELGTRAEIKNINSFRFLEKAINHEIERQIDILEDDGKIVQETRLYDSVKNETRSMRSKEEANDYRYFPCPDLLPVIISDDMISTVKDTMPELMETKKQRYINDYGLSNLDAEQISSDINLAEYFESMTSEVKNQHKLCANWIISELTARLNKDNTDLKDSPIKATELALLITRIADNTISGRIAKKVLDAMFAGEGSADEVIKAKDLKQVTDTGAIEAMVDDVLANNPKQVEEYLGGKDKMLGFFVGQIMKVSKGKANPGQINQLLKTKLKRD
jgi:aspartyl-tRNA(Asn)/glutamyl-tRNA(Gln) amidotransferase subunit B